jgi:hypothetical protein
MWLAPMLGLFVQPAQAQVGHLHQLFFNGSSWADTDLTQLTGAKSVAAYAGTTAFMMADAVGQIDVFYQDEIEHIHQLRSFDSGASWGDGDLTAYFGGPPFAAGLAGGSGMAGFAIGNDVFVYFVGSDQHIHEFYTHGPWWFDTDLTQAANGALAGAAYNGKQLVAFTTPNNEHHVYYVESNGNIHQLYYNGATWTDENLTAETGYCVTRYICVPGAPADTSGFDNWMAGGSIGNFQYVFFVASNGHVHEYSYINNWTDTDLTALTKVPASSSKSVAAFTDSATGRISVYYSDRSNHIHRLGYSYGGQWSDECVSCNSPNFTTGVNGAIAFDTVNNDHVFTRFNPGVAEYTTDLNGFNIGSWFEGSGRYWAPYGLSGFASGNNMYVYYVAASN